MPAEEIERVCSSHFSDKSLQGRIRKLGELDECDVCGEQRNVVEIGTLAEWVDEIVREYFSPSDEGPLEVDEVIWDLLQTDEEATVESISSRLYEAERRDVLKDGAISYYDGSLRVAETDGSLHPHFSLWDEFCIRAKHAKRYFDKESKAALGNIFHHIDSLKSVKGRQLVKMWEPGDQEFRIFRARVAGSRRNGWALKSGLPSELSPPPASSATAGRMNPAGMPCFYGASSKNACISEVRPAVGEWVIVGEFEIIETVKLLDLTSLALPRRHPSYFNKKGMDSYRRRKFLGALHRMITRPVSVHEEEIEYVPTQMVAGYLANQMGFDGIIYDSAQVGKDARNIVLFPHASAVDNTEAVLDSDNEFVGLAKGVRWDENGMVRRHYARFSWGGRSHEYPKYPATLRFLEHSDKLYRIDAAHFSKTRMSD